jgi:hypothetical protein
MDPLSPVALSTSVESIAGTAKQIVSNLFRYFDGVKNAPEKSRELRQEMHSLCDLLDSLNLALTSPGSPFNQLSADTLINSISQCAKILANMNARTAIGSDGFGRYGWPFSKDENQYYLSTIERHKETFTLALSMKCA